MNLVQFPPIESEPVEHPETEKIEKIEKTFQETINKTIHKHIDQLNLLLEKTDSNSRTFALLNNDAVNLASEDDSLVMEELLEIEAQLDELEKLADKITIFAESLK